MAGQQGPDPGRYVVRRYAGERAGRKMVFAALQAPRRRRFGGRRARRTDPAAAPVEVTRATVVEADPLTGDAAAWLRHAAGAAEATVGAALAVLNRALHRLATADPVRRRGPPRVGPVDARGLRHRRRRRRRTAACAAARELAGVPAVSGEKPPAPREERLPPGGATTPRWPARSSPTLRARLDLDQGRTREAALQLEAALSAACEELRG